MTLGIGMGKRMNGKSMRRVAAVPTASMINRHEVRTQCLILP